MESGPHICIHSRHQVIYQPSRLHAHASQKVERQATQCIAGEHLLIACTWHPRAYRISRGSSKSIGIQIDLGYLYGVHILIWRAYRVCPPFRSTRPSAPLALIRSFASVSSLILCRILVDCLRLVQTLKLIQTLQLVQTLQAPPLAGH